MAAPNHLFQQLHGITLETLSDTKHLVSFKSNETVEHAIKLFQQEGILSAPVFNAAKENECIGIVDVLDIVAWIQQTVPSTEGEIPEKDLQSSGRAMALKELGDIIGMSNRDAFIPVFKTSPVTQAVRYFANGVHRVPLFDEKNNILGAVTQTDVVRYLAQNLHQGHLKPYGEKKIADYGLGNAALITLSKRDTVLHACRLLANSGVSALALLEVDGKLGGNFSATDLQSLATEALPSWNSTVEDFLLKHSPASLNPIVCNSNFTLGEVAKLMMEDHIHRLWVVDGDYKPTGLISMTDVMKVIA